MSQANGLHHLKSFLGPLDRELFREWALRIEREAPLAQPTMADGTPLHLQVTSAGALGWWADAKGYRYLDKHPVTGRPWPAIPEDLLYQVDLALCRAGLTPGMRIDTCLINHYKPSGSLGLHIDRTERDQVSPIVSFSFGADAEFVLQGGPNRTDKRAAAIVLSEGDALVQAMPSRRWYHGITKILPTMGNKLAGDRINLTLRKVVP